MTLMRLVHYLNQFFGGLGGEEAADAPVQLTSGAVGPGIGLQQALGERGAVVATIIGGDNYVSTREADAADEIVRLVRQVKANVLVAGPAFNAGRYGLACGIACQAAQRGLGMPALAAMHPDNPAADANRRAVYIVATGASITTGPARRCPASSRSRSKTGTWRKPPRK